MVKVFTKRELNQIINDYIDKLERKISIDKVILFGSYSKGTATELSDIDLLVLSKELPENEPKGANGYYLDSLVGEFNPNLEVIAIHPNKLNNEITKSFFNEILETGEIYYPRDKSKEKAA